MKPIHLSPLTLTASRPANTVYYLPPVVIHGHIPHTGGAQPAHRPMHTGPAYGGFSPSAPSPRPFNPGILPTGYSPAGVPGYSPHRNPSTQPAHRTTIDHHRK